MSSIPTSTAPPPAAPAPAAGPFPLGSVQHVAGMAWRLCLREDPVGLLVVPFIIFLPVYVFLTLLAEVIRDLDLMAGEPRMLGAVVGALPLVLIARVFGEAWILLRADALAHGRRPGYAELALHAFGRSWPLAVVMLAVYAFFQVGFFFFVVPGFIVWALCSFANQAAVLGPGRLIASLRLSRDLLEHNALAWLGMVAYWMVVFLGLGILFGILRQSLVPLLAGNTAFVVELVLGMPLQVCLLVFSACWTLFYRELEARRRAVSPA